MTTIIIATIIMLVAIIIELLRNYLYNKRVNNKIEDVECPECGSTEFTRDKDDLPVSYIECESCGAKYLY